MKQRLTYNEQQTVIVKAFLADVGAKQPKVSPSEEFNRGIDLSQVNQDITDCQLRCDKVHHFIALEEWQPCNNQ